MKCFQHSDDDAVGVCKACYKGVCRHCAADLGRGLACRGVCEEEVRALIRLIESNIQISPAAARAWGAHRSNLVWTAAACIVLGLLFGIWGALNTPPFGVIAGIGGVLLVWGVVQAAHAFRLRAASGQVGPRA